MSERTIRERVEELPPEPPKETTAADLLALRMGAGWVSNTFWPGGDSAPRGSTEASPRENVRSIDIEQDQSDPMARMWRTPWYHRLMHSGPVSKLEGFTSAQSSAPNPAHSAGVRETAWSFPEPQHIEPYFV